MTRESASIRRFLMHEFHRERFQDYGTFFRIWPRNRAAPIPQPACQAFPMDGQDRLVSRDGLGDRAGHSGTFVPFVPLGGARRCS
jgi:hypothetical protein